MSLGSPAPARFGIAESLVPSPGHSDHVALAEAVMKLSVFFDKSNTKVIRKGCCSQLIGSRAFHMPSSQTAHSSHCQCTSNAS